MQATETHHRHSVVTRIWHWSNAAVLLILLMSGLMIFNAHPRLYWGSDGAWKHPAWLEIGSDDTRGHLRIGSWEMTTTGWLGLTTDGAGAPQRRAFPGWATLPSTYDLAGARRWHLSAAWLFVALLAVKLTAIAAAGRRLLPARQELHPRNVAGCVADHARLRFDHGSGYNILQKLSYLVVLLGLLPTMLLTGLAMSPAMAAAWPWLLDIWGGRQSARSVHFIASAALVLFVIVHVLMVLLAGPRRQLWGMTFGRVRS